MTATGPGTQVVPAAGVLPWRRRKGSLQVALVHRPRYDDWSWPKGKLDPGEEWVVAAVRETFEETGLQVRPGLPLPSAQYDLPRHSGEPATKQVRYWSGQVIGGSGVLEHEIDAVDWLEVPEAYARLTYARDRAQLQALAEADRQGTLKVWPLVVVRHAAAVPRSSWTKADRLRPLNRRGVRQSADLVPLLTAYRIGRVVTSDALRCLDSIRPYATATGIRIRSRRVLSEVGFEAAPGKALRRLEGLLQRADPVALCTHRPVLPHLLDVLAGRAVPDGAAARSLSDARDRGMHKGELLVCHVAGSGAQARIVAVERHRTK